MFIYKLGERYLISSFLGDSDMGETEGGWGRAGGQHCWVAL